MGELGTHGPAAHRQIGELATSRGLVVIATGEGVEGIAEGAGGAKHFPVLADAAKWLAAEVKPGDSVLFKGSRSATIERVMNAAFPPH
jgi:UDP-N-acetylmuramoyl-tripeptide--D-alanyl-D-alanine ligase